MNIAVILSAGSGSRFGSSIPKQFINLAGCNVIEYTITAFEQNENINEICVVADIIYHEKLLEIINSNNFKKVKRIIQGGKDRKSSSYNAIKEYQNFGDVSLIFHDAVRPFVSQRIINDTIEALKKYNAVDVAIPTADTIIQVNQTFQTIEAIPQRSKLQRGQTPQGFKLGLIQKAHELALLDNNEPIFTDDCGLVKQYIPDEKIFVVRGEEKNIKITYPEDLLFAEKLIQFNSISLSPKESLNNLKDKVIVVFGGNSGIGKDIVKIATNSNAIAIPFSRINGVDISKGEQVDNVLYNVYKMYGKIDVVINCAATLTKKELIHIKHDELMSEINTNFIGAVNILRSSHKYLKQSQGSLILFTSSSYTRGRASYSLYSSTKAAIVNLAQSVASEWHKDRIKVNVMNPSRTATAMRERNFGKEHASTLLSSETVATNTLQMVLEDFSGLVIDLKKVD